MEEEKIETTEITETANIEEKNNDEVKVEEPKTSVEELKKEINVLKGKLTTFENKKKDFIDKRKDLISKVIYDKKNEIENTYGEILTEAEKRLEATKKEKATEHKKNIDALIDKNTQKTKDNIFYLKNEIKRVIKDNKLPGFVNSEFYLTMWAPSNLWQVIKGLFISILLMVIPTALVFYVYKEKLEQMFQIVPIRIIIIICIYLLFIFVFAGLWLIIDKMSKKKPEALKEIRELRKNIKDSEKEVKKISIRTSKEAKDTDFDYTKLDREIEAGEIEVKNLKEKKQNALIEFTNTTQPEIIEKLNKESQFTLDDIEKEIEKIKEELNVKQKEYDELRIQNLDMSETNKGSL